MQENMIAQTFSLMMTITVMTVIVVALTFLLIRAVAKSRLRAKLKKIDLKKYVIVATNKGMPKLLQGKENPNELIYL